MEGKVIYTIIWKFQLNQSPNTFTDNDNTYTLEQEAIFSNEQEFADYDNVNPLEQEAISSDKQEFADNDDAYAGSGKTRKDYVRKLYESLNRLDQSPETSAADDNIYAL